MITIICQQHLLSSPPHSIQYGLQECLPRSAHIAPPAQGSPDPAAVVCERRQRQQTQPPANAQGHTISIRAAEQRQEDRRFCRRQGGRLRYALRYRSNNTRVSMADRNFQSAMTGRVTSSLYASLHTIVTHVPSQSRQLGRVRLTYCRNTSRTTLSP